MHSRLAYDRRNPDPSRVRAAIYIDFDNVFGGLMGLDEDAAMDFARQPDEWLDRLSIHQLVSEKRDFLIRRCYLNPNGSKFSEKYGNERTQRVYFSRFRSFLTRHGFEVIDCPTLTAEGKNAADIRMALDMMDALWHQTRFDEFVLLSGDSDFTPVLQRLRQSDRRVTVISSTQTATAYEAMVDRFLDEQSLIELVRPKGPDDVLVEELDGLAAPSPATPLQESIGVSSAGERRPFTESDLDDFRDRAVALTLGLAERSEEPVRLTEVAAAIRHELGEATVDATGWFGRGTMSGALASSATAHLKRSQHFIWDPDRHEAPPVVARVDVPDVISEVATVTGMPRLSSDSYAAAFGALAAWLVDHPFNLTAITRDVRDLLQKDGHDVGRKALGYLVKGCGLGGANLLGDPPPTAIELSSAFVLNMRHSVIAARLELDEQQLEELGCWIDPSRSVSTGPDA